VYVELAKLTYVSKPSRDRKNLIDYMWPNSLEHNVYKRRLDQEGKPLADPVKHEVGEVEKMDNSSSTTLVSNWLIPQPTTPNNANSGIGWG
jgi:hypothetical protein